MPSEQPTGCVPQQQRATANRHSLPFPSLSLNEGPPRRCFGLPFPFLHRRRVASTKSLRIHTASPFTSTSTQRCSWRSAFIARVRELCELSTTVTTSPMGHTFTARQEGQRWCLAQATRPSSTPQALNATHHTAHHPHTKRTEEESPTPAQHPTHHTTPPYTKRTEEEPPIPAQHPTPYATRHPPHPCVARVGTESQNTHHGHKGGVGGT